MGCATSDSGIVRLGGECVGVTDGSYVFDRALTAAEACVKRENDWVTSRGKPYVTIAFLGPLTSTATRGLTTGRVPHQLEGGCTALHRVNQDQYRGDHPLVRMILANEGSNEGQWQDPVGQLEGMTGAPDHLVAVVGLGLSQSETALAARSLSDHSIPMVGDVITADGLDTSGAGIVVDGRPVGRIEGLTRVAPTTSDELAAVAAYLPRSGLRTAILVTDINRSDLYTKTLADSFRGQLAAYLRAGGDVEEPYDGSPNSPGPGNPFTVISNNLCGIAPPDMVFYAGREVFLPTFLRALSTRPCKTRPVTVVTGSDAAALTLDPEIRGVLGAAPISVVYTALADPGELGSAANPSQAQFTDFTAAFSKRGFSPGDLVDGWGIMSHDAVLTAAIAIRNAAGSSGALPATTQVRDQLYLLNVPTNSVPGASGTFELDPDTGNPVGRPLPVFRLAAGGAPILQQMYTPPRAA